MFLIHGQPYYHISENILFENDSQCNAYFYVNQVPLKYGLAQHMTRLYGPPDNGVYSFLEMGCVAKVDDNRPLFEQRQPLIIRKRKGIAL